MMDGAFTVFLVGDDIGGMTDKSRNSVRKMP
jgi:hypothetical protein